MFFAQDIFASVVSITLCRR